MISQIQTLLMEKSDIYIEALKVHMLIPIYTVTICCIIGIPLGIICAKNKKISDIIINAVNLLKLIPILALLILMMPIIGSGLMPAVMALCLVCMPAILINTCIGIKNIDSKIIESARGMGMDKKSVLFKIELPLAIPMILAGIRTATIQSIAAGTLAAYVGGGGLGYFIILGFGINRMDHLILGAVSISIITLLADLILSRVQRKANLKFTS